MFDCIKIKFLYLCSERHGILYNALWPSSVAIFSKKMGIKKTNFSLHARCTIDANDLAVYPLTVLGSEEAHDAGNVQRLADAALRRPGSGVLVDLVVAQLIAIGNVLAAHGVVHVGLDATRSNAVDGNPLLTSIYTCVS